MVKQERFSSRLGFILSGLGMAVGTGNIWRFPRVAGADGGGAFVIAWLVALVLWSIPLLMVEMAMGKHTRKGVVNAFAQLLGKKRAWIGGFVAFVSTAIAFYYAVVSGWCLRYLVISVYPGFSGLDHTGAQALWDGFTATPVAVLFQALALGIVLVIVARGITRGIELANKVLIPVLYGVLVLLAVVAVLQPGGIKGVAFLFSVDPAALATPKTWLSAFSQSAWSTGAGWGLLLTYAVYTRQKEDIAMNSVIIGVGNNIASIFAALAVIPTVFALLPQAAAHSALASGNEGLSFIWLPTLIVRLPGGNLLAIAFFLALFFAATSSLISLIELPTRVVMEWGISRAKATWLVGAVVFLAGVPSALNMSFFKNQDWVWGLGLLVSGVFFAIAGLVFGLKKLAAIINESSDFRVPARVLGFFLAGTVPVSFVFLMGWWFWQSIGWGEAWWNPWAKFSVATAVLQWLAVALVLISVNALANRKTAKHT